MPSRLISPRHPEASWSTPSPYKAEWAGLHRGLKGDSTRNVLNLQKLKITQDPKDPSNGLSLDVSVWAAKASWFNGLNEGDDVIALGLWKAPALAQTKAIKEGFFKTYTNRRLTLTLNVKSQIAKI